METMFEYLAIIPVVLLAALVLANFVLTVARLTHNDRLAREVQIALRRASWFLRLGGNGRRA
jgi:hypothetical protein